MNKKEKSILIFTAIWLAALVGIPNSLGGFLTDHANAEKRRQSDLVNREDELRQRLADVESERELVLKFSNSYEEIEGRGYFQEPNKVKWLEVMQDIIDKRGLYGMTYDFDTTENYAPGVSKLSKDSTIEFRVDKINLQSTMLHDLDIFMFIEDYRSALGNSLIPTYCEIAKTEPDYELRNQPNFSVECTFDWVSLIDPNRRKDSGEEEQTDFLSEENQENA